MYSLITISHTMLLRPSEVLQRQSVNNIPHLTRGILCITRERTYRHCNRGLINITTLGITAAAPWKGITLSHCATVG